MMRSSMRILGVTGGIAAGKSAVSEILRGENGYILDADKLSHAVILKGAPAYDEILASIPGEYADESGEIDRKRLGEIVFADKTYLKRLETIVHKYVCERIENELRRVREEDPEYSFIVIDAPLLFESGLDKRCDSVWVIAADVGVRASRLAERNGYTNEYAAKRIAALPGDYSRFKAQGGDYTVIENNGAFEELKSAVTEKLSEFLENN